MRKPVNIVSFQLFHLKLEDERAGIVCLTKPLSLVKMATF